MTKNELNKYLDEYVTITFKDNRFNIGILKSCKLGYYLFQQHYYYFDLNFFKVSQIKNIKKMI